MASQSDSTHATGQSSAPGKETEGSASPLNTLIRFISEWTSENNTSMLQKELHYALILQEDVRRHKRDLEQRNSKIRSLDDDHQEEIRKQEIDHVKELREQEQIYKSQYQALLASHRDAMNKEKIAQDACAKELSARDSLINERDQTIKMLREEVRGLRMEKDAFLSKERGFRESNGQQEQRIQDLEKKVQRRDERSQKLVHELAQQNGKVTKLEKDLEEANRREVTTAQDLQKRQRQLQEVMGYTKTLEDNEDPRRLSERFRTFWESCCSEFETIFEQDISPSCLRTLKAWAELTNYVSDPTEMGYRIHIARSNDPPAKLLRRLAVLTIFSKLLARHIFTPSYLIDSDPEFALAYVEFAKASPAKERFFRGLLVSFDENVQLQMAERRHELIVEELMGLVKDFLTSQQSESLREALSTLTFDAINIWRPLQRGKARISAETLEDPGWSWQKYPSTATHEAPTTSAAIPNQEVGPDEPAVCVFPRIYIVGAESNQPIFSGFVTMKSQVDAAEREIRSTGGSAASHRRQFSSLSNGGNGSPRTFLGSSPLGR